VGLKRDRLAQLVPYEGFTFEQLDLFDREGMLALFRRYQFQYVVHLAAQAGVRYSLENPFAYSDSNLSGFLNLLEGCRLMGSSIWCLPHRVRCMEPTARCPLR
jgi:UDP-glucuronate 4-epimerase